MEIITNSNAIIVAQLASQELDALLARHNDEPILLLLSGGSAFDVLRYIKPRNLGPHVTITMLDDRFSQNPEINNFAKLTQTDFYKLARTQNCHFISTLPTKNEVIGPMSHYLETKLKNWIKDHPDGIVIATMGIGEDGHTAGIMPYPEDPTHFNQLFSRPNKLVVGYHVNKEGEQYRHNLRITTTLSFIEQFIDYAIVFVIGVNKKTAVERVMAKDKLVNTPAAVINKLGKAYLFTDQDIKNQEARRKK